MLENAFCFNIRLKLHVNFEIILFLCVSELWAVNESENLFLLVFLSLSLSYSLCAFSSSKRSIKHQITWIYHNCMDIRTISLKQCEHESTVNYKFPMIRWAQHCPKLITSNRIICACIIQRLTQFAIEPVILALMSIHMWPHCIRSSCDRTISSQKNWPESIQHGLIHDCLHMRVA